ncbi:MAG: stage IV sporulation protein A [Oscillospiraceae bacterium]|nr:stage IV sporulation protein A [Oscillospiraceae bacterium]
MESRKIYEDIARRTSGDIYIGVVGPVRTGKSTFIKRFMETLVIPNIDNVYRRERARDELPQSGSGRTIMTAEPKFVPEEAVQIEVEGGVSLSVRLIDSVGYLVNGAVGQMEDDAPRMVTTPWFDHEIPMTEAAEVGTRKVIAEHSTIGIVITTDGTVTDIPREDYIEAEERVIRELQELGKPFLVLLNSDHPADPMTVSMAKDLSKRFGVSCLPVNCLTLDEEDVADIIKAVLYEFPLKELDLFLPSWVDALPYTHPIKEELYSIIREKAKALRRIREAREVTAAMGQGSTISRAEITSISLGSGVAQAELEVPRTLFYATLSEQSGFTVRDDGDLLGLLTSLSAVKGEYDKVSEALRNVREEGYGIVIPSIDELTLEEPEIVRQGGRYGVKLRASAPSIHMLRADIETVISPIVGSEKQSEEMISYLLQEFEGDTKKIWESNIFGKSFHELVNEDLQGKLMRMPEDARKKLRETLERIINEGSGGLICIIL